MSENDWKENLSMFNNMMFRKIGENLKEKGLSWRKMSNEQLLNLIQKYMERRDYVSIANIAYMLWENQYRRKLKRPIKGIASLWEIEMRE